MAIGCAVMDQTEDSCSLSWLWVAEEYRNRGAGGALLDTVCKEAAEEPGGCLMVTYPADAQWAAVMEYILLKRGGMVLTHAYPQYRFSREELEQAPFLADAKQTSVSSIKPLSALAKGQLDEFAQEHDEIDNYMISHADFDRIDQERSMVLIQKGEIQGMVLISTDGAPDVLSLDLLYLKKSAAMAGLALLRQAAFAALRHPAGLRELRFLCTEEISNQMCKTLMGAKKSDLMKYCHATVYLHTERGAHNE